MRQQRHGILCLRGIDGDEMTFDVAKYGFAVVDLHFIQVGVRVVHGDISCLWTKRKAPVKPELFLFDWRAQAVA
jgi:hypothetical protein